MRIGNGTTHRCDLVRKPSAEPIPNAPAEGPGVGTVEGVDEDANRGSQSGPACQPGGMGKVSVNHVGRTMPEPVVEANPAAWIGKALPHLQGQECDAAGGKVGGGGGSSPRERDDTDVPAASFKPFGDENDLALCASDPVESRNQQGKMAHGRSSRSVASMSCS